jgi:hypothetical protein
MMCRHNSARPSQRAGTVALIVRLETGENGAQVRNAMLRGTFVLIMLFVFQQVALMDRY